MKTIEELEYELEEVIDLWEISYGEYRESFGDKIDLIREEIEILKLKNKTNEHNYNFNTGDTGMD